MTDRELTNEEKDKIYLASYKNAVENIKKSDQFKKLSRKEKRKFLSEMDKRYISKFL